jgi:hypothetical protein
MQRTLSPSFVGARLPAANVASNARISSRSFVVSAAVKVGDKAPAFTLKSQVSMGSM